MWTSHLAMPSTVIPPQPIENGFVEGADYSYGAMIIYSCFPFQVAGHTMQTCEESGWSSSIPTCVPIDCGLPHIDFGDSTGLSGDILTKKTT